MAGTCGLEDCYRALTTATEPGACRHFHAGLGQQGAVDFVCNSRTLPISRLSFLFTPLGPSRLLYAHLLAQTICASLSLYLIICQPNKYLSLYSSLSLSLGPHFARLLLAGLGRQGTVDDAATQRRLQLDVALQLVDPPGVCVRACMRA
jgi:hypothetical protein